VSVGLVSYLFAFIAFAFLTLLLLFSWRRGSLGTLTVIASVCTTIWAGISAIFAGYGFPSLEIVQFSELLRNVSWCFFLLKVLEKKTQTEDGENIRSNHRLLFHAALILAIFAVVIAPLINHFAPISASLITGTILISWTTFSIIGLLLIEQLYRTTGLGDRWAIKYLCFGLGAIFSYDFFVFSNALLFNQLNIGLWSGRGLINALAVPLIAVSAARNPSWDIKIHVSRQVVFHSITLVGAGIYLLAMAAVGYYIRFYGESWGIALQVAFLCGAVLLLLVILFSGKIRAKIRVLLSKHFFNYKYDYREEWLRFTQTLAEDDSDIPLRTIRAIATLVNSPGGGLWIEQENRGYECLAYWNMPESEMSLAPAAKLSEFLGQSQWVIDIPEYRSDQDTYEGLELPTWMDSVPDAWLLIPLLFKRKNIGFILLTKSDIEHTINWEDRDLLKTAGQQAAIQIAQYQADLALVQARQFEAFNRLSAYVIHDLKNILAQQSLIVSNAEKHKHKPEFVDDVISTINNSVGRMTRLMEQMQSGMRGENHSHINLNDIVTDVVAHHSVRSPMPTIECDKTDIVIQADRGQLVTVFGHIIQNAQEATGKDGYVAVRLTKNPSQAIIEIEDDGPGMDREFIRNRLFRPFDSTKGLTGMGIGLFESREFVRTMGGDISVTSTPGCGATFCITLPRAEPS